MARKPKQGTLPGVNVTPDEVGKAAKAYLKAIEKADDAKAHKEEACAKLVETMKKKRRRTISVEGRTITLRHVEAQDMIKVKKADQG
ncbi:MAG: hypothetical protein ACYSWO_24235 [Planctomycetota bacterium]|jgi:hypothetical protein